MKHAANPMPGQYLSLERNCGAWNVERGELVGRVHVNSWAIKLNVGASVKTPAQRT